MLKFNVDYYQLLSSLSMAMDFSAHGIMRHHQRVALIALQIGKLYGLDAIQLNKVFIAAILHDAGSSTWEEKDQLAKFSFAGTINHCKKGYLLFKDHPLFDCIADIILHHHDRWHGIENDSSLIREQIPIESRIIHLADRIDVLIRDDIYILEQRKGICEAINKNSGVLFDPRLVEAFNDISLRECFWLDLHSEFITDILAHHCPIEGKQMEISDVTALAQTMSKVIDFKSPFTRRHSAGVANVANFLGIKAGFPEEECELLRVSGLLHDLGKLGVPDYILNKPGKLTREEYNIMKRHTYYTYHILKMVEGFDTINSYASYHHETLNGQGYPFKIDSSELSIGSRIVAVADIFTALTEERPYRKPMDNKKVVSILHENVKKGAIDTEITALLLEHYDEALHKSSI